MAQSKEKYNVLIAPLDWGLGHATRCIPIINELLQLNCTIIIAADGATASLLKAEFKNSSFIYLKGYQMSYSRNKKGFAFSIFKQVPKIINRIYSEQFWLKSIIKNYSIDGVISDNRFGLYTRKIPCIYLTHQLAVQTGNQFLGVMVQKIHYHFIKKYSQCWVPDFEKDGLAGKLSHPKKLPKNVLYIGPLSRFEKRDNLESVYDLFISISGPEPQRSIFEKLILSQLSNFNGKVLLLRGLPLSKEILIPPNNRVIIKNHLSAQELNTAIEQSKMFISRSGYTTIMDLVKLNKNAVLVPTPGQTEQEYLAQYLMEKGYFMAVEQSNFILENIISAYEKYPFKKYSYPGDQYKNVINEFVGSLKSANFASQ